MRRSSLGVSRPDPKVDLVVEVDSAGHRSSRARDARCTLGHRCQFGVEDVVVHRAKTGKSAALPHAVRCAQGTPPHPDPSTSCAGPVPGRASRSAGSNPHRRWRGARGAARSPGQRHHAGRRCVHEHLRHTVSRAALRNGLWPSSKACTHWPTASWHQATAWPKTMPRERHWSLRPRRSACCALPTNWPMPRNAPACWRHGIHWLCRCWPSAANTTRCARRHRAARSWRWWRRRTLPRTTACRALDTCSRCSSRRGRLPICTPLSPT